MRISGAVYWSVPTRVFIIPSVLNIYIYIVLYIYVYTYTHTHTRTRVGEDGGQSKVTQADLILLVHQHVLWFYVPVHHLHTGTRQVMVDIFCFYVPVYHLHMGISQVKQ